ncbi:uncharacterized protein MONBRDRAFT_11800 [Monosiga brevicollis MX1]|uniref:Cytochrome b5 heme-binding domain-containing protein n=1 Tax=Monosiga brevicollis TaxID=81824 RepID=A9VAB5_MONBE|nr:uncharacterized protein MONBRDRAFT_11800 [Monosiga brevicollis MX1]EDQ85511.1 predicted protein [Monosiga brevicollis MX1]|eukprot:XP_001749702.1 hypothetical protein [Monosiga brevicollis MX1]
MASSVERDDLVWVNNVPYNVKEFASRHPGGKTFVSLYGGRDATDAFATYHRRTFPHKSMQGYAVPKEVAAQHEPVASSSLSEDDPDFLNLCREVNEFLHKTGRGKGFAPPVYYLKVALILVAAVVLEVSVVREPNVFLAALLGFVFALIGLNIQHDANHGAVSQRPWINIVLGMTQDWIGGNSLLWLHQHTTIHHIECNDLDHDRDMMDNPVLRFSPLRSRWFFQSLQGFYFLALEAGYAAKVIIGDWYNLLLNMYEGVPISRTVPGWRWWSSVLARICWLVRLVAIPVYLHGWQASCFRAQHMFIVHALACTRPIPFMFHEAFDWASN